MQNSNDLKVNIRDAVESDIPPLQRMIHALAKFHGDASLCNETALRRDAFTEPAWIYIQVAEYGNDLLGYSICIPLAQVQFGFRGMDMHHLFVDDEFRRMGIGRALIQASLVKAKAFGCSYLAVSTAPQNASAQKAYLAIGFEPQQNDFPRFAMRLD